jgi:hypothetical protein
MMSLMDELSLVWVTGYSSKIPEHQLTILKTRRSIAYYAMKGAAIELGSP